MALLFSVVVSKWGLFQYTMHFLLCNLNRYNSLSFIQYLNYVVIRPRGLALVLEILNWKLCYSCFAEGWSRAGVYQTRTNREGFVWWGLQGSRQSDPTSGGHQNNWLRRSWRWNWRHPTGNSSPQSMWFSLCHQILRIIPQGEMPRASEKSVNKNRISFPYLSHFPNFSLPLKI